jgi:hypothetical protein
MKTQNTTTGAANTTAARHTPGPWVASGSAVLAKIADPTRGFLPAVVTDEGLAHLPIDEKQANARLIAAAPELLDALREIELLARDIKRSNNANAIVCKCMDVIGKASKPKPIQLTGWTHMA